MEGIAQLSRDVDEGGGGVGVSLDFSGKLFMAIAVTDKLGPVAKLLDALLVIEIVLKMAELCLYMGIHIELDRLT